MSPVRDMADVNTISQLQPHLDSVSGVMEVTAAAAAVCGISGLQQQFPMVAQRCP